MSAGSVSLESAIRTCKVDTAWANRIESDRFLNPNNMVCPVWNGVDTAGRQVCPDSFYTKRAGCNSAEDRVIVENNVSRPQYVEYLPLDALGIKGDIYGDNMNQQETQARTRALQGVHKVTGSFGQDWGGLVYPSCGMRPYKEAMSQENFAKRGGQAMQMGYQGNSRRRNAGF